MSDANGAAADNAPVKSTPCASAPPAMRGFCSVSRGLGQADPIGKLPGKIRDEKLGVLVTNQDNTMNSSEDSLQSLSSTNALGESLGRGLVSFTNGGRFGNSLKHVVSTQGFGTAVNVEDLIVVMKRVLAATSPRGRSYGGKDSDVIWTISRKVVRTRSFL